MALAGVFVLAALAWRWPDEPDPFHDDGSYLQEHAVVVLSDRLVCSMDGAQQATSGIVGQDGSHSVAVDGVVYWNFGDTVLRDGAMNPNGVAWSADRNAADCISLVPKGEIGGAASLLPREPETELTVWPLGMEATAAETVHFFYASVVGESHDDWQVVGVGLASFDTKTLTARRAFDGALPWPAELPQPKRTVVDGGYVYVLLGDSEDAGWQSRILLARVPVDQMEELSAYEYWQPADGLRPGRWLPGLWDSATGAWGVDFEEIGSLWLQPGGENGVEVAYNEYLDRWLAIYATGFATSINVRAAEELTGPWDGPETTLVRCPAFHSPTPGTFLCYSGAQQEVYDRDGGRTIYVSYSNGDSYQVYLHEIRFGAAVVQWSDAAGRTVYVQGGQDGPHGFRPDGIAFYAADIAVPGFAPIHRWVDVETGAVRYAAAAPDAGRYRDAGVDFYAPADLSAASATNTSMAPVHRWTNAGVSRYSFLNLAPAGYERQEVAFYGACPDSDGDALSDCDESFLGTDALLADTDGDGLADGYERSTAGCDPLVADDDGDGITNVEELLAGENPCNPRTAPREVLRAPVVAEQQPVGKE